MNVVVEAVHIHVHGTEPSPLLAAILEEMITMNANVQRLQDDVTNLTSVVDSANALILGLAQQIRDNAGDPAALASIADGLESASNSLAASVAANTPADPASTGDTTTTATDTSGATAGADTTGSTDTAGNAAGTSDGQAAAAAGDGGTTGAAPSTGEETQV